MDDDDLPPQVFHATTDDDLTADQTVLLLKIQKITSDLLTNLENLNLVCALLEQIKADVQKINEMTKFFLVFDRASYYKNNMQTFHDLLIALRITMEQFLQAHKP